MDKHLVYADNAATTPVAGEVLTAMLPFFTTEYGNASTLYHLGQSSHDALDSARAQVAALMNAEPSEIFFVGSGTEADNMALRGMLKSPQAKGKKHMITSTIEHHAILHTAAALEKEGYRVTYVPVDSTGTVDLAALEAAITPDTALVSVMFANNEIGTINPIAEIGAICKKHGVIFHTDAVQAYGHVPIDVKAMNIDLLSISAHKINGPKGVGAIYIRRGIMLDPVITGGGQESNRRSGTENIAGIVGLGVAAQLKHDNIAREREYVGGLSKKLTQGILKTIPQCSLTGHPINRLPGTSSFVFAAIEGESLVLRLDLDGICAATGSACSTGSLDPSHVLMGIGLKHATAHGSLRLTLGVQNTEEDVDYILEKLPQIVEKLRFMSPVWKK